MYTFICSWNMEHMQCPLNRGCLLYGVSIKGGLTVRIILYNTTAFQLASPNVTAAVLIEVLSAHDLHIIHSSWYMIHTELLLSPVYANRTKATSVAFLEFLFQMRKRNWAVSFGQSFEKCKKHHVTHNKQFSVAFG